MEVDPMEMVEEKEEEKHRSRLNAAVAISVALLATFMGICKIKDDNTRLAMQQVQANRIDTWAWYQARNIREEVLASGAVQLKALANTQKAPADRASLTAKADELKKKSADQGKKKQKLQDDATGYENQYQRLDFRHSQFDMSEAALALAISLFALTSLTQKKWLFGLALVPTLFGVLLGLSGLFSWGIHFERLAKWLS